MALDVASIAMYGVPFHVVGGGDPCSRNSSCAVVPVDGVELQLPSLIPTCLAAAAIGLGAARQIWANPQLRGSTTYGLTFLMFGIMMPTAMVNDVFLPHNLPSWKYLHLFFGLADCSLTSNIAVSFMIDGFVDVGLLNPKSRATKGLIATLFTAVVGSWLYTMLTQWWAGFYYLYVCVIAGCCGLYCLTELVWLARHLSFSRMPWIILGGVAGGVGLAAVAEPNFMKWLCVTFGCEFSGMFVWFVLSDVSMFALYRYYMTRASPSSPMNDEFGGDMELSRRLLPRN